jgi:retron-type reverse transcriptase
MHLGVRCKTLWYCIYTKESRYKTFTISKSNGKRRLIHSPDRVLKYLQSRISQALLSKLPMQDCVGAYVVGKSCRDVAERHVGHKVRIGMDLKDFFPTHSRGRVRAFFRRQGYTDQVAGLISDLCTAPFGKKHLVPQGSPASPTLCNLMAQEGLDKDILHFLHTEVPSGEWVYSRYSDDLTLSTPHDAPAIMVNRIISGIRQIIKDNKYSTNTKKTKVQRHYRRQKMLGMVINEKISIPKETYRKYRAILFNCMKTGFEPNAIRYGFEKVEGFASHLLGKINYFQSIDPIRSKKLKEWYDQATGREMALNEVK